MDLRPSFLTTLLPVSEEATFKPLTLGNSLVVQRLGLSALAAVALVQSLVVRELRSHKPRGAAKKKKTTNPDPFVGKLPHSPSHQVGESFKPAVERGERRKRRKVLKSICQALCWVPPMRYYFNFYDISILQIKLRGGEVK